MAGDLGLDTLPFCDMLKARVVDSFRCRNARPGRHILAVRVCLVYFIWHDATLLITVPLHLQCYGTHLSGLGEPVFMLSCMVSL